MTRKDAMRQTQQENVLMALGFTQGEAEQLRRISMTLHRWHELECNGDVQRDENTGQTFYQYGGGAGPFQTVKCADRETGALNRLRAIVQRVNAWRFANQEGALQSYVQGDPRGAALYILRPGDVPEGCAAESYYSRGVCVY